MRQPSPGMTRAAGIALGVAADAAFGDPRRHHPVAGFGRYAARLERSLWRDSRRRGALFTSVCVGSAVAVGAVASRVTRSSPCLKIGMTALATWATIGARSLVAEGVSVHQHLAGHDLAAARRQVTHLVGRDPESLDEAEIARATVESIAENCSDAAVAPLFWGAVAGIPGLLGYRAVNTLDAMVGYRSTRYQRFGWASARLDDLANLLPARITAVCAAALSADRRHTWSLTRRDARRHPSPNSGWCEASYAAALGLQLGGTNVYAGRTEHRPELGDGPAPTSADILRAARLTNRVILVTTIAAAALSAATSLVARIRTGDDPAPRALQ